MWPSGAAFSGEQEPSQGCSDRFTPWLKPQRLTSLRLLSIFLFRCFCFSYFQPFLSPLSSSFISSAAASLFLPLCFQWSFSFTAFLWLVFVTICALSLSLHRSPPEVNKSVKRCCELEELCLFVCVFGEAAVYCVDMSLFARLLPTAENMSENNKTKKNI